MKAFIAKQKIFFFFLIILTSYLIAFFKLGKVVKVNKGIDPCDITNNSDVYKIYSDLHIFSKKAKEPDFTYDERTIYLGDIYDLKCAEDKEVCQKRIDALRKRVGNHYIRGNHELGHFHNAPYHYIENGILFTHGHKNICFSDYKVKKNEENGNKGPWNRINSFFTSIPYIVEKRYIARAVDYAKEYDCHTIVFGHTHKTLYDKTFETKKGNIRVINVPRGITYLNIPQNQNIRCSRTGDENKERLIS